MATKNIVPRATGEGGIGTSSKKWGNGYFDDINVTNDVTAGGDVSVTGDVSAANVSVTGTITGDLTGDVTGDLTGNVTGNVTGDVTGNVTGDVTGNADTATSATNDGLGNNIANTYQPAVVGAVIAFAGSTSPAGWLLCDGSAVSRTDYANLYAVIGDTYGSGDGSTTFNLPDLIDKFVEGSATAGTEKTAGLPNITGSIESRGFSSSSYFCLMNPEGSLYSSTSRTADYMATASSGGKFQTFGFDASRSSSIYGNSTTVQPPALTMRYIIKY